MEQEDREAGSLRSLSGGEFASRLLCAAFGIAAMAVVSHMGLERYENEREALFRAEMQRRVWAEQKQDADRLMGYLHPGWDAKP